MSLGRGGGGQMAQVKIISLALAVALSVGSAGSGVIVGAMWGDAIIMGGPMLAGGAAMPLGGVLLATFTIGMGAVALYMLRKDKTPSVVAVGGR